MLYFTSDFHLNSENIIAYGGRPFSDSEVMGKHYLNETAKLRGNTVFHVGDFCLTGRDRHGASVDDASGKLPVSYWYGTLTSCGVNFVTFAGNHDDGHNFDSDCKSAVVDLCGRYRNVYVNHFPSYHERYRGLTGSGWRVQINLCGHAHNAWLVNYDDNRRVLNVNVGVDVWRHRPVGAVELADLIDFCMPICASRRGFSFTRAEFESARVKALSDRNAARRKKKADRYRRKGLTPEECERRKAEAMAKKGLSGSKRKPHGRAV